MPFRRWLIMAVLLAVSLIITIGPAIYVLIVDPTLFSRAFAGPRPPRSVPFLQLAEPIVDYGVLRLRGWGWYVGVPWFASKGVYAAGLGVGMALGGQQTALLVGLPLAALWLGIVLFIWLNRIYFDR